MRIDGTRARSSIKGRAGTRGRSSGGGVFKSSPTETTAPAAPSGATHAATGIDAILALQGVEDSRFAKKRAVRHAQSMLETLEEMKTDLLAGSIGEGRLNRLMALVTRARQQADPELDALIDDIDLRAQVELAKLGRFAS